MLVLSRKQNQAVRFPNLGISVRVCQISGNKARIGVDAPDDVVILRDELCDSALDRTKLQQQRHDRRNNLNRAHVALGLVQRQLEHGLTEDAQATLNTALDALEKLDNAVSQTQAESPIGPNVSIEATSPARTDMDSGTDSKRRALIVEDNDNERELLAGYLRLSGFKVDTASNGLEAIKQLTNATELPQVVILDMRMPKLDGAKTVSNIRHREDIKHLRLFALSGTSPQEMNVSVGPRGVNRWFEKPINPHRLVEQISAEIDELAPDYVWPLGVSFVPNRVPTTV